MSPRRFLVVWCPDWAVIAAREEIGGDIPAETPLALSHGHYVTACCGRAKEQGVRPGQRLRDAQATCPGLRLIPDRPERDQRVFERILSHLADTIAQIAVIEPGVLVAKAPGLARYYGSEQAAAQALRQAIAHSPLPLSARVGIADTLFAAQQAARLGTSTTEPICVVEPGADAEFLAPLPISVLEDSHLAVLLGQLGIRTLGDFAAMEQGQVRDRFGPSGELLRHCAAGDDPRSSSPQDVPPGTDVVWRSEEPLSDLDSLSFALLSPATQFIDGLIAAHSVCINARITMVDDRGKSYEGQWTHPRYFTADDLVNRVRWQWEGFATAANEEYQNLGIVEVTFQSLRPDDLIWHEPGLWSSALNHKVEHVVAQLQSELGYRAVTHATTRPGHRFSETDSSLPWGQADDSPVDREGTWPGALPKPLPATVFQPALSADLCGVDGRSVVVSGSELSAEPSQLTIGTSRYSVTAWAGPWPVVERWWDRENSQSRYRLQLLDHGGMGWLVSCPEEGGSWSVEARYD